MSLRLTVICPFCATKRSAALAASGIYQCKTCGAWGNFNAGEWTWHEPEEAKPTPQVDHAVWFRRLFSELLPDLPAPVAEYRFHRTRKWPFDCAWPQVKLAVEIDGGNAMARIGRNGVPVVVGRHTMDSDYEKLNAAIEEGWFVLRFTTRMLRINPYECVQQTARVLRALLKVEEHEPHL